MRSQKAPAPALSVLALAALTLFVLASIPACRDRGGSDAYGGSGFLGDLAKPQDGRSMRATSTMRVGEVRRGGERNTGPRKYDPKAEPRGDLDEQSNWDNFHVAAGRDARAAGRGRAPASSRTSGSPSSARSRRTGRRRARPTTRRCCCGCTGTAASARRSRRRVGDFFANCFGKRSEVISLPVVVEDGDSYNCFWQMPFRKSARIEIVNQSDKPISLLYYNIDWIKKDTLPEDTPYFYAQYRQEYPVEKGKDYVILDTKGKGHYVGTVLAVRTRSPAWFGEGDEKIYIDGEAKASIWGTGTEDYFLSAWGLKKTSTPYFGVPYFDQWGIVGGHTSAYRWHLNDPIVFNKGIKVTIEHFGWMSAGRESRVQGHELERARGRLFQRGVLVSDRRADVHRPGAGRPSGSCPASTA